MPRIKVLPHEQYCPEGAEFEVEQNANLCQSLLDNNIKIEHCVPKNDETKKEALLQILNGTQFRCCS